MVTEGSEHTHPVGVEISLWVVNHAVVGLELFKQDFVDVYGRIRDNSEVLQTHGVAILLEVVDEINELGIDVGAGAGVGRLRVDDIYIDVSAMVHTKGRRVE